MPRRVKRAIRTVCTDMYEGFILAVKEVLGEFWKRRPPFISREYQGG